jgi:hypothetical protein
MMYTLFLQTRGFNISPFVYMMYTLFLQTRGFKILPAQVMIDEVFFVVSSLMQKSYVI